LIFVLVLIAVVVGIALPSLSGFARSQTVGDSANRAMALARWARTEAITRGVCFRLNFDPAKHAYWLTMQNGASYENSLQDTGDNTLGLGGGNTNTTTAFAEVGEEMGRIFLTPDGVNFDCNFPPQPDGSNYIEFRPSGRCDPGTIGFTDLKGQVIRIGCLTGTEQFHVLSPDEEQLMKTVVAPPAQVR
jgi:Tfp pilus assembly protein FimT